MPVSFINPGMLRADSSFKGIANRLSQLTSFNLALDAGAINSYDGSSQTWTDPVAANNVYRGTTSGAEATDPAFVGSAGSLSAGTYFQFDGGDLFKEASALTFSDNWHKNNGACTLLALVYIGAAHASSSRVFSNSGSNAVSGTGIDLSINASRQLVFGHAYDNVVTSESKTTTAVLPLNSWSMIAACYDEATTALDLIINSTAESFVTTASTSTVAKGSSNRIGAADDTANKPMLNGERLMLFGAWSRKLTTANIAEFYTLLKAERVPTLP